MIIGTAGHVDHGKSSLVCALTGRPMGRLAEEQRRGMTIELGFAPLLLADGRTAGVVDVPGHEDFIRTMVAGASGVDLALLVIAADEGMMPQTEEHLQVLEQLGVAAGLAVLTKIDLVEPAWLELVIGDVSARLAGSPVAFGAPVPVSVRTGVGMAALRQRIDAALATAPARSDADLFRLPVDRAFSVAGIGTVLTGTCWSGAVAVGEEIRMVPGPEQGRVRSIESHGGPAAARPGARIALGVSGIERGQVRRGQVAVAALDPWMASRRLDVRIVPGPTAPELGRRRQRVRLHLGTGEWIGWLAPHRTAGEGLARITLDRDIVARGGDRFVLRRFSPLETLGGGTVLDPAPPARAPWPPGLGATNAAARLRALVTRRRHGLSAELLAVMTGLPAPGAEALAAADPALVSCGGHWILRSLLDRLAARAVTTVTAFHRRQPAEPGIPLETLRTLLVTPPWLADAAVDAAMAGAAIVRNGDRVRTPGFQPAGAGAAAEVDEIVALLEAAGLHPPTVAELAAAVARPEIGTTLRLAATAGRVAAVARDRYYARSALVEFEAMLAELGAGGRAIDVAPLRDRTGLSRKYLIPLLEWADARGITTRVGDVRRYRAGRAVASR